MMFLRGVLGTQTDLNLVTLIDPQFWTGKLAIHKNHLPRFTIRCTHFPCEAQLKWNKGSVY